MAITAGGNLNSVPNSQQMALSSNYLDFTDGSTGWAQQYLPDLMAAEAEVFGTENYFRLSLHKLALRKQCLLTKWFGLSKVDYIYLTKGLYLSQ